MGLVVEHPGAFGTVQDLGRPGFRGVGVPVGGAFDLDAHTLADALVGNDPAAATLELTLFGGTFRADLDTAIGLAGAPMDAWIDRLDKSRSTLSIPTATTLHRGERLRLGGTPRGARAYLAVAGGFSTPALLGSHSVENPLRAGERLAARESRVATRRPVGYRGPRTSPVVVRYLAATGHEPAGWSASAYRVGPASGRMGVRLDGPPVVVEHDPERLSTPTIPGTIQVAGGRLIVLGPACGTLGGYPVVGHVVSADMGMLAQAAPGDEVRWRRVELAEARSADAEAGRERRRTSILYGASAGA